MDATMMPPEAMAGPAAGGEPTAGNPQDVQFYDMLLGLQQQLEDEWNTSNKPMYAPWYDEKDYPKPDKAAMLTKAQSLETDFAELRRRIENEWAILDFRVSGVFKDFRQGKDNPYKDAGIVGEVEHVVSEYADREIGFDAPARFRSEEDEASKKVDFALWTIEQAARQHHRMGGGPFKIEKYRTLVACGRVAWQVLLNLDADEDEGPFLERLVDPATCYPVYESKRGLRLMVRRYATTLGDAVAAFDTKDENLYNKYFEKRNAKTGQFQTSRQEHEYCSVTEYWDRRWRAVFIDDVCVLGPIEHKYGFVPFVYQLSGLGMPAYLRDPSTAGQRDMVGFEFSRHISTRDVSAPHKGIGLVSLLRVPHQFREALITRMLKAFDRSMEPPLAVKTSDIHYNQGLPKWSWDSNSLNPLRRDHHEIQPMNVEPSLPMLQGLMGAADDSRGRLQVPEVAHGVNDKSNVAGYATNLNQEAGLKKLVANDHAIVAFEQQCMEMRLKLYRDWGHLIKQGREGEFGKLIVPRDMAFPDQDRSFLLTPGDLRRTGININVTFSHISIHMLGPLANALGQLQQLGYMPDLKAMKLLGSSNPLRDLQQVKIDKVMKDPAIELLQMIQGLLEQGMVSEAAFLMKTKMPQPTPPAAMMGPGMMGPGMQGDPMASLQSPVGTVVGDSNAMYGQGPGEGAGRPPGAMATPSPFGTEP